MVNYGGFFDYCLCEELMMGDKLILGRGYVFVEIKMMCNLVYVVRVGVENFISRE